jgi:methyltransferase (TIGR00027 family)
MQTGRPSRTALGAALHRAAHQVLEGGRVFGDPLALRILGVDAASALIQAERDPSRRALRLFIAVRARLAEEALQAAFARGVRQLVVLGAGLDTYAYRNPLGSELRIFEVDHPSTQAWKRERLAEAAIPVPANLVFAPVDFEREALAGGLARAGFDPAAPAFFIWLGVVPYLSEAAILAALGFMASLPGGAHVFFDYGNPLAPGASGEAHAILREQLARGVAAVGESFRSHFEPGELHDRLRSLGFEVLEDLGPAAIRDRLFPGKGGNLSNRGGHVLHAVTSPRSVAGSSRDQAAQTGS